MLSKGLRGRQSHSIGLGKQKKRRQVTKEKAVNLLTTSLPPAHPLCILHPHILFVASLHLEAFLTTSVLFFPAWSCAEIPANTDSRVLSLRETRKLASNFRLAKDQRLDSLPHIIISNPSTLPKSSTSHPPRSATTSRFFPTNPQPRPLRNTGLGFSIRTTAGSQSLTRWSAPCWIKRATCNTTSTIHKHGVAAIAISRSHYST